MYSLYIHIPFCRRACHYCDFHFSTTLKRKGEMVKALCEELILRKGEAVGSELQTIYLGGGTPFCVTVDHDTPNDHKVTLRYRDTMKQERVDINDLRKIMEDRVSITSLLKKINVD